MGGNVLFTDLGVELTGWSAILTTARHGRGLHRRKDKVKNEIILKALAEASDLEVRLLVLPLCVLRVLAWLSFSFLPRATGPATVDRIPKK